MSRRNQSQQQQQLAAAATRDAFAVAFPTPPDPPNPNPLIPVQAPPLPAPLNQQTRSPLQQPRRHSAPHRRQPRRAPRHQVTLYDRYEPSLRHFMTWKTHQPYLKGHVFSHEQLLEISAQQVYHWAKFRVYGDSEADENVVPPIHYRLASVMSWKKSISFFMPNSHMEWNEAAHTSKFLAAFKGHVLYEALPSATPGCNLPHEEANDA